MPTASTAQILGVGSDFETFAQKLQVRRTLFGEIGQVSRHIRHGLVKRKLWADDMRMQLIACNSSVQGLGFPAELRELHKEACDIKVIRLYLLILINMIQWHVLFP